ncbi:hypothetical protein HPB51_021565 [Rhipicephalus microplus]|uniref:Uncharacterized protein n=1 Tax=Rhipicephalus microplus TaxID=6941 RepID=A0A9J6DD30_RHIMP|nr:hypothetical protein HPB51_021565 [Rhipicephalus microplus]
MPSASHVHAATSCKPAQRPSGRHDKRDSGQKSYSSEASEASRSSHSGQCRFCGHEFHRRSDCPAAKAICSTARSEDTSRWCVARKSVSNLWSYTPSRRELRTDATSVGTNRVEGCVRWGLRCLSCISFVRAASEGPCEM